MARTLKGMPEITAGSALIDKIRHGRRLSRNDIGVDGLPGNPAMGGMYIKILDDRGELSAVLHDKPEADTLEYACVFAHPEG
jgi:hypothetical protein